LSFEKKKKNQFFTSSFILHLKLHLESKEPFSCGTIIVIKTYFDYWVVFKHGVIIHF